MELPLQWKRELLISARRVTWCWLATEVALTEKSMRAEAQMGVCYQRERRSSLLAVRKAYTKALWWKALMDSVVGTEGSRNSMEPIKKSGFNLKGHQEAFKQRDVV